MYSSFKIWKFFLLTETKSFVYNFLWMVIIILLPIKTNVEMDRFLGHKIVPKVCPSKQWKINFLSFVSANRLCSFLKESILFYLKNWLFEGIPMISAFRWLLWILQITKILLNNNTVYQHQALKTIITRIYIWVI